MWLALAIAVAAVILAALVFRDRATPAEVSYSGPVGTEPGDPGVYRYDTVGFESVDALAGARHDYPEVTAVVIEAGPCGPVVRWEPLAQRRDEWELCGPGPAVSRIVEFHAWFGIAETTETECSGLRIAADGTSRWEASCTRPETTIAITVEHLGTDVRTVGGQGIATEHLRMTEVTTGRTSGQRVTDLWFVPGTPLYARKQVVDRSVSSSPIGDVVYVEEYTLDLRSLTPTG